MKTRKNGYGDSNMVGRNIEAIRLKQGIKQKDFISKLQTMGLDINPTSYSKMEGQQRIATDREVYLAAKILGVSTDTLFEINDKD